MAGPKAQNGPTHWAVASTVAVIMHAMLLGIVGLVRPHESAVLPAPTLEVSVEVPREVSLAEAVPASAQSRHFAPDLSLSSRPVVPTVARTRTSRVLPAAQNISKAARELASDSVAAPTAGEPALHAVEHGAPSNGVEGNGKPTLMSAGSNVAPAMALASKPRLLSMGSACQGVFSGSETDVEKLTMVLNVRPDGTASPTAVRTSNAIPNSALKRAALRCSQRLKFLPARNAEGSLVAASSIVSLTIGKRHLSPRSGRHEGAI